MTTIIRSKDHLMNGPLGESDVDQFLNYGFVKIARAFDAGPGSDAARWIDESWGLMGIDRDDPESWPQSVTRVPATATVKVAEFAPHVYGALGQLMGGVQNVVDPSVFGLNGTVQAELTWSNEFLVNYRWCADQAWKAPGPDAVGWHVDGNWFHHFLDSPEQGVLLIVCWADMVHQGGATFIAPDSLRPVAQFLSAHPEGVGPNGFPWREIVGQCKDFREVEADAGDVFLVHPFMMHASSHNAIKRPRFMTNPAVSRCEPMCFNRPDGKYDAMETAVLNALGVDTFDFAVIGERRQFRA